MSAIIKAENISKKYIISHQLQRGSSSLKEKLTESVSRLGKHREQPSLISGKSTEEFWALKDVAFELNQGDRLGIIGRNGAGKSTLLKVLSRITEPTTGRITMKGRVASLLEVGTGFHPELTGRENVFLNGSILGMSRSEIRKKFDEIVAFAEVDKFLDTPVKRYSSGMYVRLAFAVAAHLEPEILIVDEVLAVGDAQFQKKCLGKMQDVGKEGRTVIFVSHNMAAVNSLCNKGIFLKSGELNFLGDVREAVALYNGLNSAEEISVANCARRGGKGGIQIQRVWVTGQDNVEINRATASDSLSLQLEAIVDKEYQQKDGFVVGFSLDTLEGQRLVTLVSSWVDQDIATAKDRLHVKCNVPAIPLFPDRYLITVSISHYNNTLDYVEHCAYLDIVDDKADLTNGRTSEHGYISIPYQFEVSDRQ